jgi:hypothetical protein
MSKAWSATSFFSRAFSRSSSLTGPNYQFRVGRAVVSIGFGPMSHTMRCSTGPPPGPVCSRPVIYLQRSG